jgi:hypothetical protein
MEQGIQASLAYGDSCWACWAGDLLELRAGGGGGGGDLLWLRAGGGDRLRAGGGDLLWFRSGGGDLLKFCRGGGGGGVLL